ncbi:MAG: N-acetyltransferase [Tissierella sp.]|nr:N-acetyltransferase [Tissierella sp.]
MIRKFDINELETVMGIWLDTNIKAHDFIDPNYWRENYDLVKEMLPDATVFVYEDNDQVQGFIGLMDNYIAGIFVNSNSQSKGIGKALLNYVKENNSELSLQVYKKNFPAINFYLREDFLVIEEQIDKNVDEVELIMNWKK